MLNTQSLKNMNTCITCMLMNPHFTDPNVTSEDAGWRKWLFEKAPCAINKERICCYQLLIFVFLKFNKQGTNQWQLWHGLQSIPYYKLDAKMLYIGHLTDVNVFQPIPMWAGFKPVTPEVRGYISNYKFPLSLSVKMPKVIYFFYIKMHCTNYIWSKRWLHILNLNQRMLTYVFF